MRVLKFGLSPMIRLGLRKYRKKESECWLAASRLSVNRALNVSRPARARGGEGALAQSCCATYGHDQISGEFPFIHIFSTCGGRKSSKRPLATVSPFSFFRQSCNFTKWQFDEPKNGIAAVANTYSIFPQTVITLFDQLFLLWESTERKTYTI